MINNSNSESINFLKKISILDSKKVFYPLRSVLLKKDISFNDDDALIILPLPEDVKFPSTTKITDSGQLFNYKIDITITDQSPQTEEELMKLFNKKVIAVFHYDSGKVIFGCNENPLQFLFNDDNTTNPISTHGFSVVLSGTTYYLKVNR